MRPLRLCGKKYLNESNKIVDKNIDIKKLLDGAIVKKSEQPYKIPDNWVWVKLLYLNKNKTEIINPNKYKQTYFELYSVPSFSANKPELIIGSDIFSSKQKVESGDILLCKINPKINRVWCVGDYYNKSKIASNEWIAIKPFANIYNIYLLWFFRSNYFRNLLVSNVSGVGGSLMRSRPKEVMNYSIPIPPLTEQTRIVNKLESMLGKIKEAKKLIEEAKKTFENRKSAILNKAFTGELTKEWRKKNKPKQTAKDLLQLIINEKKKLAETDKSISIPALDEMLIPETEQPYEIPKSWVWTHTKYLIDLISDIINPTNNKFSNYLGLENLKKNGGIISKSNSEAVTSAKFVFKSGDVLYGKLRPYLNKHSFVEFDGICSTDILVFRFGKHFLNKLFDYYLNLPHVQNYTVSNSKGINLPRVSPSAMENLFIPFFYIEEQTQIVKILESIFEKENKCYKIISELEEQLNMIEKSILSKAFRGELGTNNPDDEPAIELLERVLQEKQEAELTAKKQGEKMKKIKSKKVEIALHKSLYEILKEQKKKLKPEDLYSSSKYNYETIEDFYLELKNAIETKLIIEERPNNTEIYLKAVD